MAERQGWDGSPLPERHYEVHKAIKLAQDHVRRNAETDRVFGGEGNVTFDDAGSRAADALVFLAQEMLALGTSLIQHGAKIGDKTTELTGRAILDHLPTREEFYATSDQQEDERER